MAYTYTLVSSSGQAADITANFAVGDVMQYAGEDFIWTNSYGGGTGVYDTSSINYFLANGHITHMDGSNTPVSYPNSDIFKRFGTADAPPPPPPPTGNETATVTLTSKTVAAFTKAAELIGENRTHIKTAESNITGLQTRVIAAEGSIATVDQRIADAETRAKNSAVEQILGGATNAQLDTIKELGDSLTNLSGDGVAAINAALAKRVSVDAQTWTSNEQAQARTNIGAASGSDVTNAISASVGDPSTIDIDAIFASVGTF